MHLLSSQLLASIYPMIGGVIGLLTAVVCIAFLLRRQLAHWEGGSRPPTTRPATQYLDKNLYRGGIEFHDRTFGRHADTRSERESHHENSTSIQREERPTHSLVAVRGRVFRLLPDLLAQEDNTARANDRR